jgi:hypothetical protein
MYGNIMVIFLYFARVRVATNLSSLNGPRGKCSSDEADPKNK